jgi:hypothetical protein
VVWDFDVKENDGEITVRAEVPGFEENELDVQINQETLVIRAEKEQRGDGREEYRSFYRAITLPPGIDTNAVQATYRNGVLELHIPRTAGSQSRRVQIQGHGHPGAQGQRGQQSQGGQTQAGQAHVSQTDGTTSQGKNQERQANQRSEARTSEKAAK